LLTRICTGLPGALASLDADAERDMRGRVDSVHAATALLTDTDARTRWLDTLAKAADRAPALISGRLHRLLLDANRIDVDSAALRMTRQLSAGTPAAAAAGWVEGFLAGSGVLLVHDRKLLGLVDDWLADLPEDRFQSVLPALRRTFGTFTPPERRAIGEQAVRRNRDSAAAPVEPDDELDPARVALATRTVARILGIPCDTPFVAAGTDRGEDER
jgi:hypothetical protein